MLDSELALSFGRPHADCSESQAICLVDAVLLKATDLRHSMLLEDQKARRKLTSKDAEARLDEILRETRPSLFWD